MSTGDMRSFTITTLNTPLQLITDPGLLFKDINIQVMQANVFYGDGDRVTQQPQGATAPACPLAIAGSIITYDTLRGSTLWFKSSVASTPAIISCAGTEA